MGVRSAVSRLQGYAHCASVRTQPGSNTGELAYSTVASSGSQAGPLVTLSIRYRRTGFG